MNLYEAEKKLSGAGIEDAEFECRLLAENFLHIAMPRSAYMKYDELDKMSGFGDFCRALEKRAARYPLQYIIGEWEFYGLRMKVNESCLIPRPDTELVAERAIIELKKMPKKAEYHCIDLCTGSGCIAAAVMSRVKNAKFTLVDISKDALGTARENIELNGFSDRTNFVEADVMSEIFPRSEKFDLVTANPPYIPSDVMPTLEAELEHEPRIALTDEGDGLSFYRAIVKLYKYSLTDGGAIVFEHGWDQYESVREIAKENGMSTEVIIDYGKRQRGAVLKQMTGLI